MPQPKKQPICRLKIEIAKKFRINKKSIIKFINRKCFSLTCQRSETGKPTKKKKLSSTTSIFMASIRKLIITKIHKVLCNKTSFLNLISLLIEES